jgi:hypothetical protein
MALEGSKASKGSNHIFARFCSFIRAFSLLKICAQSVPGSQVQPLRDLPDGQGRLLAQFGRQPHFARAGVSSHYLNWLTVTDFLSDSASCHAKCAVNLGERFIM